MNKVASVKLSLRKLFIATLAIGPLAILPSPLWAVPSTGQYSVTNGSVSLVAGATISTFTVSDRSVLVWTGNDAAGNTFNLPTGETWTFTGLSSTGAVLNKVGYNTNGTTMASPATAVISGALNSTGKVFILANGNIVVNSGASIDTTGGLILSTLNETSDFNFTTQGNLSFTGTSNGSITLGNTTTYGSNGGNIGNGTGTFNGTVSPVGNLTAATVTTGGLAAWAGAVVVGNISVAGDLLVNQTTSATGFTPVGITGFSNVTVTTNNGAIGNATGLWIAQNGTTSLNTGGNKAVLLTNAANNFGVISVASGTGTGGNVTINDVGNVTLGASTIGQDLVVTAGQVGTLTSINTNGTVAVKGNLTVSTTADNASINIGSNSTVAGLLTASTANASITFNGLGNINVGVITTTPSATGNRGAVTITTNGVLTIGNTITAAGNTSSGGAISLTGGSIVQTAAVSGGNATNWGSVSMNASAGNITTGTISSNQTVTLNASAGSINSAAQVGTITSMAVGNASIKTSSTGSADLSGANSYFGASVIQFTGGNITLANGAALVVGTTNATGNYTIIDGAAGGVTLGTGSGTAGQNITVGGVLTVTANNAAGVIADNAYSAFNVFGNVNLTTGTGAGTGGTITLNAARTNSSLSPLVQLGAVSANTSQNAAVVLAETNTLNLGTINATTLVAASVSGNVVQTGAIATTVSTTASVGSAGTITLGNTSNSFTALSLSGGTDASATSNGATVTLTGGASAPGNTTLTTTGTGKNAVLGAGTYSNLTVNSGGTIDVTGAVTATGNLSLTAGGSSTPAPSAAFTPTVSVTANSTGVVTAVSISNTRLLSYTTAPTVDFSSSTFTTTPTATITLASDGTIGNGLTVTGNGTGVTTALAVLTGGTVTTNITESTGKLLVSGTTNIGSPAMLGGANEFSTVNVNNAGGPVAINDVNDLTVTGTASNLVTAIAGGTGAPVASTWALNLGTLNVSSLTGVAANGGGGTSGAINQLAGTTLHSENTLSLTTNTANITVANVGNSAGRVELRTGGNATVSYAEDSTIKLGNISVSTGNVTLTARNGSIIEDVTASNSYSNTGTMSLQAPNGSITVGNTTMAGTGFSTSGGSTIITANAPGGIVALISGTTNLTVGSINANSLVLTNGGSGNMTQSAPISVFGTANITSSANVTLTNAANNFGPIVVSAAKDKNVSITENGTLNLRTVTVAGGGAGNFTATSVNGDIISSGFGGVRPGGTVASPGTGIVTLAATKGNITVGDATTDFPTSGGVVFNGNNVSLTVLGNSTLTLGANTTSSVATTLAVTSAIGSIANAGNIVVSGNTTFTTGNGNISMNQAGDQFGNLRFSGNQVSIIQSNDMKILTGSSAIGASSLASSGNISIVNVGGVASFGNTLSLIATGTITLPKLIQVANTLTVNAAGTKDLSALSVSGDLGGKSPVNLGTGAYSAPQP